MPLSKPVTFETAFTQYIGTDIIGEGGAGHVYRATDDTGGVYAIKLLETAKANSDKLKRFKNEVEFCRRNQHRNIITVIGDGVFINCKKHSPFYVMPLYTGSLRTLLESGIPPERVLYYFSQLLDGVEAAHLQRVTHRDLKPENVLYDKATDLLLIADFGIAHFEEEAIYTEVETSPNTRLANFQYAAPEQRNRGAQVDYSADIYALGLMLNEMFTGMVPHGTRYKTISNVAPEYGYLDEIISMMLYQSASERPNSIDGVKQQLIGKKNDFITRQRISELKQTVVSAMDLDDPLIIDPSQLVEFDYERGMLYLILSRSVNEKWIDALHNMGSFRYLTNKHPDMFAVSGNKASVRAQEHEIQETINLFKDWLPIANRVYAGMVYNEKFVTEQRQRQQLQEEIEEQERRQRIRANVRI
jgi:serine/threonine protein kinase